MLTNLIRIAAVLQLGLLIAAGLTPGVLDMRNQLRKLPTMLRQLIWVHAAFIVIIIIGFATISLIGAAQLAGGSTLARALAGFIAIFWGARLSLQFFLFDARPYLTRRFLALGYYGLHFVFAALVIIYGAAATLWN